MTISLLLLISHQRWETWEEKVFGSQEKMLAQLEGLLKNSQQAVPETHKCQGAVV